MIDLSQVDRSWLPTLEKVRRQPSFGPLDAFLELERHRAIVYPPASRVFQALSLTPFDSIKSVIVGQDPYHGEGQAQGLAFSVGAGTAPPPSLRNILTELSADQHTNCVAGGDLSSWARKGVLLLNSVLTVRAHEPGSHRRKGWEQVTDSLIAGISERPVPIVFVLWGRDALQKRQWINESRHLVITSAHPSPLSASRGFFGSRPFSRINEFLEKRGREAIDWGLADC